MKAKPTWRASIAPTERQAATGQAVRRRICDMPNRPAPTAKRPTAMIVIVLVPLLPIAGRPPGGVAGPATVIVVEPKAAPV